MSVGGTVLPLTQDLDSAVRKLLDGDMAEAGSAAPRIWQRALVDPIREFIGRSGKGIRARLVAAGWSLGGGAGPGPSTLALILEYIHAGSLVIDDIQDASTHRRGSPTLHRLHGEALAINAGNWLYLWPVTRIRELGLATEVELELTWRIVQTLVRCHHGQALDLGSTASTISQAELADLALVISRLKTGALTELAITAGAVAAGACAPKVEALSRFGATLGVRLQMLDDLGNLRGKREPLKRSEDLRLDRVTWPWAWLSKHLVPGEFNELQAQARMVAAGELPAEPLAERMLARLDPGIVDAARAPLGEAFTALEGLFAPNPALAALVADLVQLERSYG